MLNNNVMYWQEEGAVRSDTKNWQSWQNQDINCMFIMGAKILHHHHLLWLDWNKAFLLLPSITQPMLSCLMFGFFHSFTRLDIDTLRQRERKWQMLPWSGGIHSWHLTCDHQQIYMPSKDKGSIVWGWSMTCKSRETKCLLSNKSLSVSSSV